MTSRMSNGALSSAPSRPLWQRLVDRLRGQRERGAGGESLELIIIAPVIVILLLIGIAAARSTVGSGRVEQAAAAGARAASLTRDAAAAQSAANSIAAASLAGSGVTCQHLSVSVDTSGFRARAGQPASVSVEVACTVSWSDLTIPGWPGSKRVTGRAASPLDTYRERP